MPRNATWRREAEEYLVALRPKPRVRALNFENPLQHMAEILEQALDIALDKKDVKRKHARRLERKSGIGDNFRQESCPGKRSHRLGPVLSGEKLPELIKGLSVKAPAANPVIITGALMLQGKLGSEPAPYHWRGFQRKHSPGPES